MVDWAAGGHSGRERGKGVHSRLVWIGAPLLATELSLGVDGAQPRGREFHLPAAIAAKAWKALSCS
jgi:hypothetical protein